MNGIETPSRKYFVMLLLLCAAMTASNAYLLRANRALKDYVSANTKAVPEGTVVDSISGLDINNNPINLTTASKKATVVMVFSPTCPYCKKNWPAWTSVMHGATNPNINFVMVDLTSTVTPQFLDAKQVGNTPVIRRLDPAQFAALNLNLTPQTIVIGPDSRVEKVFTGAMTPAEINNLVKLLT